MTYTIEYSKEAERTLRKWKKSNPNLFEKATKILMDMMQPTTASSTTSMTTASRYL